MQTLAGVEGGGVWELHFIGIQGVWELLAGRRPLTLTALKVPFRPACGLARRRGGAPFGASLQLQGEPGVWFSLSFLLAQLQRCKIDKSKLHIFKVDSWAFGGVSASWSRHQSQANERARHLPSLPLWRVPVVPGGEGTAVGRVNSLRCVLTVRSGE